jgi:hypothetical protein
VLIGLAAVGVLGVAHAAASGWQLQAHLRVEGVREHATLFAISCPSKAFCVAVGENDAVATSSNPDGGQAAWKVVQPEGAAGTDCRKNAAPSCQPPNRRDLRSVSCPSPQLCVAVSFEGYVYSSTDPGRSGGDWQVVDADGPGRDSHLMSVSCPTSSMCVAVSGDRETAGKVLSTTNPTGPASAWHEVQLDESLKFTGVSCGAPRFCVAIAEKGRLLVSTNPTGGASAWREVGTPGGPGDLKGVSCLAALLCVAGNSGGNLLTSTNPDGPASSWQEADGGGSVQITGVSCVASLQCAAVDNNGFALTTDDPTVGRGGWSRISVLPFSDPETESGQPLNALFGVSCASSSFCALAGADGRIYTNDEPFAKPSGGGPGSGNGKARRPRRPRVTISEAHAGYVVPDAHTKSGVFFRFHANGQAKGFICSRDGHPFKPCHSPVRYKVAVGRHVFKVRAIGTTGLRGPIAVKRFRTQVNQNQPHH